jgi:hypothetical protein
LSFTATQPPASKQEIATPATYPPGNTVTDFDHFPDVHDVSAPLSPITEQLEAETQDTEYAASLVNAVIRFRGAQRPSLNTTDFPVVVTAMQNLDCVHETEIRYLGPELSLDVHFVPLNEKI